MAKFLISTMPETGHIYPALPIATALAARGHQVRWHTGPDFADKVSQTGASFVPMKHAPRFQDLTPRPKQSRSWEAVVGALRRLFVEPAPGQLRDYTEILSDFDADVVINESTAGLGPRLLHELGGPPWARLGVSPLPSLPTSAIPPLVSPAVFADPPEVLPYSDDPGVQDRYRRMNWEAANVHMSQLTEALDELRARFGLGPQPTGETGFAATISPFLQLQTGTLAFDYPRPELPAQVHHVGPLLPPGPDVFELPPWWQDVVSADRPVVHVTQGTVATDPTSLLRPTLDALADDDVLVVATAANPADLGPLPANVRLAKSIPYALLLPYVDVMVTNGGIGGILAALTHGLPLIGGGRTEDKPAVCARIAHTGVGIDLKTDRPTVGKIRDAVRAVLSNPSYQRAAVRVQTDFARHDPPVEAAVLLERLAETKAPVV
ncbi:glycosyltransferase [Fodinicola feengrottensis]|uniref:Glycosyltransferase n=2 Tax=Fodinicola feengrottensis TaxID=435914 RepID=A0ABP4S518_9ACTN